MVHVAGVTASEQPPTGESSCSAVTPPALSPTHSPALTDKRTAANRNNALKSTGPRTKAGKLAVAKNGVGHGIYAVCPVIGDVESVRDWKRYRKEMLASLSPCGMMETTFAERIIFTAWRLRRTVRYETEQIRLVQDGARGVVSTLLQEKAAQTSRRAVQELEDRLCEMVGETAEDDEENGVDYDAEVRDVMELGETDAQNLLRQAHDRPDRPSQFNDYWRQLPKPEAWTAGLVRKLVGELAELDFQRRVQGMGDELTRRLHEYRCQHLLSDEPTMEKVMRYEAHLSRQLHRDLHELQRLQAVRQGHRVPAPVAIDVDVAVGPEKASQNGA